MGEKIRAKEISIADRPTESIDKLMASIEQKCEACGNDKFTLVDNRIMIIPPFPSSTEMGHTFTLTGKCIKCSKETPVDITGIANKIFTNEERDKLIEESNEMNTM